jgi:hypothetical protein
MFFKTVTLTAAACALLGLGGCVSTRSNLASDADRLEHNATALAREADDLPSGADYPASYTRDARRLADDAREFRHVAESHDATDADVKAAFKQVSRSYLVVRDEVEHSDSREARSDLKPVTDAYLDVEREMGGYPVHHASAYD